MVRRSAGYGPVEAATALVDQLQSHWWGPLAFVALYVSRQLVLFPASVLTVMAGLIFGPVWGTVWATVGSNLSTAATYWIGRFFGSEKLAERVDGVLGSYLHRAVNRPFETALIMRLAYLPYNLVGYMSGFFRLRYWPFAAATAIGSLPATVSFVSFGASIDSLDDGMPSVDWRLLAVSVVLITLGIAGSRLVRAKTS